MSKELEEAAKNFVTSQESLGTIEEALAKEGGTAPGFGTNKREPKHIARSQAPTNMDIGWERIPVQNLPSRGMFYPDGTTLLIRACTGNEIKHWSTLDERDPVILDGMLNYVLEKTTRVSMPNMHASFQDLLDVDRLYIIFAINEYTFKEGENKITAEVPVGDDVEKVRITKDVLKLFDIPEKLQRFYDSERKCFVLRIDGEELELRLPTIGMSKFMFDLRTKTEREGKKLDMDYMMYALFMCNNWRTMTEAEFKQGAINSHGWTIKKISALSTFVDLMKTAINPQMTVQTSAGEVTQPLDFQGGIKSLFVIPDVLDGLD